MILMHFSMKVADLSKQMLRDERKKKRSSQSNLWYFEVCMPSMYDVHWPPRAKGSSSITILMLNYLKFRPRATKIGTMRTLLGLKWITNPLPATVRPQWRAPKPDGLCEATIFGKGRGAKGESAEWVPYSVKLAKNMVSTTFPTDSHLPGPLHLSPVPQNLGWFKPALIDERAYSVVPWHHL